MWMCAWHSTRMLVLGLQNIKSQAFKPLDINEMTVRATNITNNNNNHNSKMCTLVTRDERKVNYEFHEVQY